MEKISNNQIEQFNDQGFIIFEDIIDRKKLKRVELTYKKIFDGHYQTEILPDLEMEQSFFPITCAKKEIKKDS